MVERLRAKPGGDQINVTIGDMSIATTGQQYGLVFLVFSTIFNLLTADDQIRCFENAARHLAAGGYFVVETAVPHAWITPGKSGAGFPGLPLAVVNPRRHFTLIEATGKKVQFVRHAIEALGIENAEVIQARSETWRPRAPFDCVIARALGKLADFIRLAGHLCARDGRMLAMTGRHPTAEIEELPQRWRVRALHDLRVPGLAAARCVS